MSFLFVLTLNFGFALQQVKTKYRSGLTQVQGYLQTWLCLANENTGPRVTSRLNSLEGSDNFARACVLNWVIPIV